MGGKKDVVLENRTGKISGLTLAKAQPDAGVGGYACLDPTPNFKSCRLVVNARTLY